MEEAIRTAILTAKGGFVSTSDAADWLVCYPVPPVVKDQMVIDMRGIGLIGAELDRRHGKRDVLEGPRQDSEDCQGYMHNGGLGWVSIALVSDIAKKEGNAALLKLIMQFDAERKKVLGLDGVDTVSALQSGRTGSLVQDSQEEGIPMSKNALLKKYQSSWKTMDSDFKNASTNGLDKAKAKNKKRGWVEEKVVEWAKAHGKLLDSAPSGRNVLDQTMDFVVRNSN